MRKYKVKITHFRPELSKKNKEINKNVISSQR